MSSITETASEKKAEEHVHVLNVAEVDVAAGLDSDEPLDPKVAARLRYIQILCTTSLVLTPMRLLLQPQN